MRHSSFSYDAVHKMALKGICQKTYIPIICGPPCMHVVRYQIGATRYFTQSTTLLSLPHRRIVL